MCYIRRSLADLDNDVGRVEIIAWIEAHRTGDPVTMRSLRARKIPESPAFETGGRIISLPFLPMGKFWNRLAGLGNTGVHRWDSSSVSKMFS